MGLMVSRYLIVGVMLRVRESSGQVGRGNCIGECGGFEVESS